MPSETSTTDPTTQRMMDETGHSCPACPADVRNLSAVARNAAMALTTAIESGNDWGRARRKLAELNRVLASWRPIVDEHFAALEAWRRP